MTMIDEAAEHIASIALNYYSEDFYVFKMEVKYFKGLVEGPKCEWLKIDGQDAGWDNDIIRRIDELYDELVDPIMSENFIKSRGNIFNLSVSLDSRVFYEVTFDPDQEARHEQEVRDELGDELYEHLQSDPEMPEDSINETATNDEQEELGVPELFSYLFSTVTSSLSSNWSTVTIDFSVSYDGEYKQLAANYLVQDSASNTSEFEPVELYGPLNAMAKIRNILIAEDNKRWDSATFYLYSDGKVGIKTEHDE